MNILDIIKNQTHCVFVSPHLDDAVFSAGGLIAKLAGKTPVTVINVFTKAGDIDTLSAKAFLKQCGYSDRNKLFIDRVSEDETVMDLINVKYYNLDETDALWRQKNGLLSQLFGKVIPELGVIYPTYKFDVSKGHVSKIDHETKKRLFKKIAGLIPEENYLVFCPLAVGNHVDHILVRDVCKSMIDENRLIHWLDFPYSTYSRTNISFANRHAFVRKTIFISTDKKRSLCQMYKTQFKPVIQNPSLISGKETYYQYNLDNPIQKKIGIWKYLKMMFVQPKDFIYNLISLKNNETKIVPFDPKAYNTAKQIIDDIKILHKDLSPILIGSLGLKILGANDADILIPVETNELAKNTKMLSGLFGKPAKVLPYMTQWKTVYKNIPLDLDLIDKNSDRYIKQINLFSLLNQTKYLKLQYQALKFTKNHHSLFEYTVARMYFFYSIEKTCSGTYFPEIIDNYRFKNVLNKKNVSDYTFAIYQNDNGNIGIAKQWCGGFTNLSKIFLENEINVYKLLDGTSADNSSSIKAPKFLGSYRTKNTLILMSKYIEGSNIADQDNDTKFSIYSDSIKYIQQNNILSRNILYRGPEYYLLILPFIATKAALKHPNLFRQIFLRVVRTYMNSNILFSRKSRVLVHRDLNEYNVIGKHKKYLIDFQLSSFSDPLVDWAVLSVKYSDNQIMQDKINKYLQTSSDKNTNLVLNLYKIVFAIYDLSLSDGHHLKSKIVLEQSTNI